ncbi:hypothetical protein RFI_25098, partial [Reticulomyxa filosa]
RILQNGMIPVTHEDMVFDDTRGCSILSSDTILEHLTAILAPQRAIFWTNVDGVYERKLAVSSNDEKKNNDHDHDDHTNNATATDVDANSNVNESEYQLMKQVYVNAKGIPQLPTLALQQLKHGHVTTSISLIQDHSKSEKKEPQPQSDEQKGRSLPKFDNTGSMWSKVQVASRCCAMGCDVTITKGGTRDAVLALCGRLTENATVFVPEHH